MPVRPVIIGMLALLALWLLYRGYRNSRHTPWLVGMAALLAVILGVQEITWQHRNRLYSSIAVDLAHRADAHVECQRFSAAYLYLGNDLGHVPFGADGKPLDTATLIWDTCRDLLHYLHSDKQHPNLKQIVAVHVLAHESAHLIGPEYISEALTECVSMQNTAYTAERLGASDSAARALAADYWQQVYPHMPVEYTSGECRNGGSWDLDKDSDEWPTPAGPLTVRQYVRSSTPG